jgi:EpsI family protein
MPDAGTRITIFLGVIAALVAFHLWLASRAADLAEKKGYTRPLGFLLGFYFSLIGYFILTRLKPNEEELRHRELLAQQKAQQEEIAELEGKKKTATPWQFQYPGKRPSFPVAYVLLGCALGMSLFLSYRPEDTSGRTADLNLIPRTSLNGWKYLGDVQLDQETDKQIKADATTLRYYQSPTGQQVQMYVVYRRYGRREFNHNPDNCFPAGGYVLKKRDVTQMPWAGKDHSAVCMLFDGSKVELGDGKVGVPETTVTYFFASGKRTEYVFLKQQLWMALERIVPNKNGWTLIRLTTPRATTDEEALAAQKEFLRIYGPEIQKAITTDTEDERTEAAAVAPDNVSGGAASAVAAR